MEKRRAERIQLHVNINCYDIIESRKIPAESKNISRTGICITTKEILPLIRHVELMFTLPPKSEIIALAEVRWSEKVNAELFASGLQFTDVKPADIAVIQAYIQEHHAEKYPEERRMNKRLVCAITANFRTGEAVAKNISESGMCILTEESFSTDIEAEIMFFLPSKQCINALGRIVWKKKAVMNQYEYGLHFTRIQKESIAKIQEYILESHD